MSNQSSNGTSTQQHETHKYFDSGADEWNTRANTGVGEATVNVISQRNACVMDTLGGYKPGSTLLDIGCGTGQLVLDAAKQGYSATGLDFAEGMIEECERNKQEAECEQAEFIHASIFDFQAPIETYDVISAQGLIEYISLDELKMLFQTAYGMLPSGGAFVVGSRNRLFNVFSTNDFTVMERELGTLDSLHQEAEAMIKSSDAISSLGNNGHIFEQPAKHPSTTGVEVSIRHQYTPCELSHLLGQCGFEVKHVYGVHYHGFPPLFAHDNSRIHSQLADAVFKSARNDHRLIPQSTTFVMDARRVG